MHCVQNKTPFLFSYLSSNQDDHFGQKFLYFLLKMLIINTWRQFICFSCIFAINDINILLLNPLFQ